jgi:hypothetical protein
LRGILQEQSNADPPNSMKLSSLTIRTDWNVHFVRERGTIKRWYVDTLPTISIFNLHHHLLLHTTTSGNDIMQWADSTKDSSSYHNSHQTTNSQHSNHNADANYRMESTAKEGSSYPPGSSNYYKIDSKTDSKIDNTSKDEHCINPNLQYCAIESLRVILSREINASPPYSMMLSTLS